jgi:hypothetical protein
MDASMLDADGKKVRMGMTGLGVKAELTGCAPAHTIATKE